jgi:hypothetical protein
VAKREPVKQYPTRKVCTRCDRRRAISKFRLLSSGYRQGMCEDCERDYERERWHTRSAKSKQTAGGTAALRRSRRVAVAA